MAEDDKGSVVTHTTHLGQQWALLHTVTDKDHLPNQTGGGCLLSPPSLPLGSVLATPSEPNYSKNPAKSVEREYPLPHP